MLELIASMTAIPKVDFFDKNEYFFGPLDQFEEHLHNVREMSKVDGVQRMIYAAVLTAQPRRQELGWVSDSHYLTVCVQVCPHCTL